MDWTLGYDGVLTKPSHAAAVASETSAGGDSDGGGGGDGDDGGDGTGRSHVTHALSFDFPPNVTKIQFECMYTRGYARMCVCVWRGV